MKKNLMSTSKTNKHHNWHLLHLGAFSTTAEFWLRTLRFFVTASTIHFHCYVRMNCKIHCNTTNITDITISLFIPLQEFLRIYYHHNIRALTVPLRLSVFKIVTNGNKLSWRLQKLNTCPVSCYWWTKRAAILTTCGGPNSIKIRYDYDFTRPRIPEIFWNLLRKLPVKG